MRFATLGFRLETATRFLPDPGPREIPMKQIVGSLASVFATFPKQMAGKRQQARELEAGIDVVLDDVESEVVSTGKTPDGDR